MVITLAFHAGNRGSSPLFGRGNCLFVSERCGPRIARCTRPTSLWKRTQAAECEVRNAGLSECGECFRVLGESNPGVLLDRRGYYPLSRQPHPVPPGSFVHVMVRRVAGCTGLVNGLLLAKPNIPCTCTPSVPENLTWISNFGVPENLNRKRYALCSHQYTALDESFRFICRPFTEQQ